jgi:hypothetical protein
LSVEVTGDFFQWKVSEGFNFSMVVQTRLREVYFKRDLTLFSPLQAEIAPGEILMTFVE